jgi:diguanylate cyclase (GGDEF)-like protein
MPQVLVIHHDAGLVQDLVTEFEAADLLPTHCTSAASGLGLMRSEPPDAAVVEAALEEGEGLQLCQTIRRDNALAQVVLIAVFDAESHRAARESLAWHDTPFDDYLVEPFEIRELVQRLQLNLCHHRRNLDANPLTRLPGNSAIMRELERRMALGEEFAIGHIDLDNFKAFNDKYGFVRGDQALRLTARLLLNVASGLRLHEAFVGHIGGDDFVFIVPIDQSATVSGQIIDQFDRLIASLYDEEDRQRGHILATNRQGQIEEFPVMTMSIAVVPNRGGRLKHVGQISAIAADLKSQAKKAPGSSVLIDRRGIQTKAPPGAR